MKAKFTHLATSFYCRKILLILILSVFLSTISKSQTSEAYKYSNVAIGGGGFVSAIITNKAQQNLVYSRTDVGGAYRWDASTSSWISLLDWVSESETGYLGVESLASDPKDPGKLYMLVGISYFNGGKTAILRSTDYGNSFSITDVTSQFKAHGNGMGRQNGEKLVIDPNSTSVLYTGTRWNGLFKSTNSGVSWSRVTSLNVTTTPNENGISFVVLDPSSSANGTPTKTIFVGVSQTGTNLYRSNDGGTTFSAIAGAPTNYMPQRAVLASDNNLYITYGNGAGPHGHWSAPEPMDNGQIWKYNTTTGAWTNVTPPIARAYGGITVDAANPSRLVATTMNTYMLQDNSYGDRIFITTNGGASWTDIVERGFDLDPNGVSWVDGHAIHWAGSVEFDPFDTKKVWVTSGNGVFRSDNIDATLNVFKFQVKGLEETVPLNLVSIPNGPLVSAIGDYDGFRHTNVDQYAPINTPRTGTTTGLAFAAMNSNIMLRVGNNMYYSTNMGVNWTECTKNGNKGHVAISADGNTFLHCPETSATTYRSTNRGSSWTAVTGLSETDARPVADPVNASKFYAYNTNGTIMVSTNGGVSFAAAGSPGTGGSKVISTVIGKEGHLWMALFSGGLTRSTNSGQTFTKLNNVTYCGAVGLGKEASGAAYPTIYIWGTVNGVLGIHRSTNEGSSWVRINDDTHEYGGPGNGQFVMGDWNTYGRVYMSTAGRGIIYGSPACTPTSIVPYVKVNSGAFQQTSTASLAAGGTVTLGPQPTTGGSWSWTGPNGFTATTREVVISNIQTSQGGNYIATYTNSSGCKSAQTFTITVTASATITVRARGTNGTERLELRANNVAIGTWTLTTALQNYSATGSGAVTVHFTNDGVNRDVQVDYVNIGATTYQAESQPTNTGVYASGNCGGSNSEWLHCNGYISFTNPSARIGAAEEENSESVQGLQTFPNPVTDLLTIKIPEEMKGGEVNLYNTSGKMLSKSKPNQSTFTIDMSGFPSGLYFVHLNGKSSRMISKVIKK